MSELPGGTVSLLFTDIEGSAQLQHRLGELAFPRARYAVAAAAAAQRAIAEHDWPDAVNVKVRMGIHG